MREKEVSVDDGLDDKHFRRFMGGLGFVLKPNELRVILAKFDTNNDGRVSRDEFIDFVGGERSNTLGDAEERLAKACIWDKACHECGMAAAYDSVKDAVKSRREGRTVMKRKSLPDHETAQRQSKHSG